MKQSMPNVCSAPSRELGPELEHHRPVGRGLFSPREVDRQGGRRLRLLRLCVGVRTAHAAYTRRATEGWIW